MLTTGVALFVRVPKRIARPTDKLTGGQVETESRALEAWYSKITAALISKELLSQRSHDRHREESSSAPRVNWHVELPIRPGTRGPEWIGPPCS
jgi:hypothetical protein